MMNHRWKVFVAAAALMLIPLAAAAYRGRPEPPRYGERYCALEGFHCLRIHKREVIRELKPGEQGEEQVRKIYRPSWKKLWPDKRERDIVMKLNRMNIRLTSGMRIAVPDDMAGKTYMDYSPFPRKLEPTCKPTGKPTCRIECSPGAEGEAPTFREVCEQECKPAGKYRCGDDGVIISEKTIIVDLAQLAFAAYDERGVLLRWGPVSGGRDWGWVNPNNLTVTGEFRISRKYGRGAKSGIYPRATKDKPAGGAPVPYFMRFSPGYGLHSYYVVPGRHASHGCVRLFYEDAKWLNRHFAELGTRVVVLPYETIGKDRS